MRQTLVKRRDALRRTLAGELGLIKSLEGQAVGDLVDLALDSSQGEINSQLAEVESRELANVEKALQRIELGEYGRCEHCDGNIPSARLQAVPDATLCIRCQREAEMSEQVESSENGNGMELFSV